MAAERAPVKEEPEWGAAAAEGLYAGHEIKDEVVVGPELIQMQDIAYVMRSALNTVEQAPLQPQPAGGGSPQLLQLRSCFVRLERFPTEDLHHNLHTCETCHRQIDYKSSLKHHSCKNSVEEFNFNEVCDESAKKHFECDIKICGKQFYKNRYEMRHLAVNNVEQGGVKLLPYTSDNAEFANTEELSCSDIVSEAQFGNQSLLTTHTHERLGPHTCDVCAKEYSRKQYLIRHIQKLHGDVICNTTHKHICDKCKKPFRDPSLLAVHKRIHTREKSLTCEVCKKIFTQEGNFARHKRIHTGEKPFSCSLCNKQFAQKSNLTRHITTHTGEKLYGCDLCKKAFTEKSNLQTHMRIHSGEKPFSCSLCNKQFARKTNLTRHITTHTGEKLYGCDICKKAFREKSHLQTHMRIHTGEKPFACDVCEKRFTQSNDLTQHQRIHTGNKPFSCSVCKKQFAHKTHLTRHVRTHTGEKPFTCEICDKLFRLKHHLSRHLTIIHGGK